MLRLFLTFAFIVLPFGGQAQQVPQRIPKLSDYEITKVLEAKEIANFTLTESFLDKMEKIQAELVELPIEGEEDATGDDLTVNGMTQAIKARPRVLAVLNSHQMAVRDYVLGSMALSNALLAVVAQEAAQSGEEEPFLEERVEVSPENLEFGRQFADRIRALHGG